MKIKEFGSDFHFPVGAEWELSPEGDSFFSVENFSLFASGRSALYSLLHFGIQEFHWKRVYFPSFYCHEVVDFIRSLNLDISFYSFNPFLDTQIDFSSIKDSEESVLINVSYFGGIMADATILNRTIIIDDLTHNLMAITSSKAMYCFGSLRKELPIPFGGFCTSSLSLPLPRGKKCELTELFALKKLDAMLMKKYYLQGYDIDKSEFRKVFQDTEQKLAEHSTITLLPDKITSILRKLDIVKIIQAKYVNLDLAMMLLEPMTSMQFQPFPNNDKKRFGLSILFSSRAIRDSFRTYLINQDIYPAILWPKQIEYRDRQIQDRILFLHTDFRYSEEDILYLCNVINSFGKN